MRAAARLPCGPTYAVVLDLGTALMTRWDEREEVGTQCHAREDNLVTCVLEDTLTKGERVLAEYDLQMVLDHRRGFQGAMGSDARRLVEEASGRRVIAFMSDNHVEPDIAVESFILEAESSDGSSPDYAPHS